MDYQACRKSIERHRNKLERHYERVNKRPRAILMDAYTHLLRTGDVPAARMLSRHAEQFAPPRGAHLTIMAVAPRCRLSGREFAGEHREVDNPGKLRQRIAHLEVLESKISRAVALGLSDGFGALSLQTEIQRKLRAARGLLGVLASEYKPTKGGRDEQNIQGRAGKRTPRAAREPVEYVEYATVDFV